MGEISVIYPQGDLCPGIFSGSLARMADSRECLAPIRWGTANMTTLSLTHRILDGGQLLPPAAGWALHCLVIHKVIGVQYCILHLHQKHPRKQWPEGNPGKPTSWASFSRNFLPTMAILWLACCPWDSQGLKKKPVDLSYPSLVVGSG